MTFCFYLFVSEVCIITPLSPLPRASVGSTSLRSGPPSPPPHMSLHLVRNTAIPLLSPAPIYTAKVSSNRITTRFLPQYSPIQLPHTPPLAPPLASIFLAYNFCRRSHLIFTLVVSRKRPTIPSSTLAHTLASCRHHSLQLLTYMLQPY